MSRLGLVILGLAVLALAGALIYAAKHAAPSPGAPSGSPASPPSETRAIPPAPGRTPGDHPSAIDVFADSQLGDWNAYDVVNAGSLMGSAGSVQTTAVEWIDGATTERVSRTWHGLVGSDPRAGHAEIYPRRGLALERLMGDDIGRWTLFDLAITDDVHTVKGRAFHCKKLVYRATDPVFARKRTTIELWLSAEVPAGGLVAEHEIQDLDAWHFDMTKEVSGFGSASGPPAWGTRPASL